MHTLIRVFFHEGSGPAYGPDKRGVGSDVSYSGSAYPARIRPPWKSHLRHLHVVSANFHIWHWSAIDRGFIPEQYTLFGPQFQLTSLPIRQRFGLTWLWLSKSKPCPAIIWEL